MSVSTCTKYETLGKASTLPRAWNYESQKDPSWTRPHLSDTKHVQRTSGSRRSSSITSSSDDWLSTISTFPNSAPALMLNELHQAYLEIDKSIIISSTLVPNRKPQDMNSALFHYTSSRELLKQWETSIESMTEKYLQGATSPEIFEAQLTKILAGVEKLEDARENLENNLEGELRNYGIDVVVPDSFWDSMEERCAALETAFTTLEQKLERRAGGN